MASDNLDISIISATKYTSSWPIFGGSLDGTITFESSNSSADDSVSDTDNTLVPNRNSPLILRRPSPDSIPCEITISFTQQHEIRQVYVRSTARVYEIYYAADEKGGNEYLCTVRCGVAARDELLEETQGVGSLCISSTSSSRSFCEGHLRSESGGSPNEDGWVDVEAQNPTMLDARDNFLSRKDESCMERSNQDCFEATAEVSDADPVLSVTLRFLSIQSGDYIYINEVYVFADPVVSADTKLSTNSQETSSENATMSLLLPTLLQLSRIRRNQIQESSDSSVEERKHQDAKHKTAGAGMVPNSSQSESIQGTMLDGASVHISQPEVPVYNLYTASKQNDISCSRIERTLDELVSRVARIEHFCLRFEENLLKPISNMEARLERVEQQLESCVKTAKFSITACTRMSAPESSCFESEPSSISTGVNDSLANIEPELIKKHEGQFQDISTPPSNAVSSLCTQPNDVSVFTTKASQAIPGLVVTGPDFPYVDDEGESDSFEAVKDSPKGSPKKPVSIDDALASGLAGFLSLASVDPDMVQEMADISNKEERGITCSSDLIQSDEHAVPSVHVDDSNISDMDIVVKQEESFGAADGFEKTTDLVDEHNHIHEEWDREKPLSNYLCSAVNLDIVTTDDRDLRVDRSREADDDSKQTFVFGSSDSSANDTSVAAFGGTADNIDSSGEETARECPGVLLNILKLQSPTTVDFGIPILDVNFSSQDSFSVKSSLDALLVDVPESQIEVRCDEDDNATSFSEQHDLVIIEKAETAISEIPNSQLICLDNFDSDSMPSNREEPELQECSTQDMGASLI